jgi:dienelactone hydrolase
MATLVQDVWLGTTPRLRGRRLAPYEEAAARVVFHPDLGMTLEEPALDAFLEDLARSVDVVAFEPRGQGGSGGRFGPEAVADLRALVSSAPGRWPDGRPLVLMGHGVGAALALAAAGDAEVKAAVALAPSLPDFLESPDWVRHVRGLSVPLLALAPRESTAHTATMEALSSHPRAAVVLVPGDALALLAPPWPEIVAAWARTQAQPGWPRS